MKIGMLGSVGIKWLRDQRAASNDPQQRAELKRKIRGRRNLLIKEQKGSN